MSLKLRLQVAIEDLDYCSRNQLRNWSQEWGYDMANADRELRRLCAEGKIKAILRDDNYIIGYATTKKEEKS